MTVEQIIKAVRLCYDEEALNGAAFANASAGDNSLMNNIIKSKIGDAVRWICLYAPAEMLGGSDFSITSGGLDVPISPGIIVDAQLSTNSPSDNGVTLFEGTDCWKLQMPSNFIKLARVRVLGWHKAVKEPIQEDSEEYLQLYDTNGATATDDRPVAAIVDKSQTVIELWPSDEENITVEVSFVSSTEGNPVDASGNPTTTITDSTHYPLPPRVKTAFIYYLAFLVLSAYEDSRAARMLEIAKMNIGK